MLKRGDLAHWRDDRGAACVAQHFPFFRRPMQAAPPTAAPTLRLCAPRPGASSHPKPRLTPATQPANSAIGVLTAWNQACFRGLACPLR